MCWACDIPLATYEISFSSKSKLGFGVKLLLYERIGIPVKYFPLSTILIAVITPADDLNLAIPKVLS